jgi:hypothetical protein
LRKIIEFVNFVEKNTSKQIILNGVVELINLNSMVKCGGAAAKRRLTQKGVK